MRTWDLVKTANRNLFRNKLRTFLTVVAIFVGAPRHATLHFAEIPDRCCVEVRIQVRDHVDHDIPFRHGGSSVTRVTGANDSGPVASSRLIPRNAYNAGVARSEHRENHVKGTAVLLSVT